MVHIAAVANISSGPWLCNSEQSSSDCRPENLLTCQFFVLVTGFAVKFHKARSIRKLEIRAAADLAERGEITERASEEVPFGIRAIEAGAEVDGIWNSRAATPLLAPSAKSVSEPSTPTMKPQKLQKARKFGSDSSLSGLELPEPAHLKQMRPAGEFDQHKELNKH
jgi:hypothetical protein